MRPGRVYDALSVYKLAAQGRRKSMAATSLFVGTDRPPKNMAIDDRLTDAGACNRSSATEREINGGHPAHPSTLFR
jgi:hypothetical protein